MADWKQNMLNCVVTLCYVSLRATRKQLRTKHVEHVGSVKVVLARNVTENKEPQVLKQSSCGL